MAGGEGGSPPPEGGPSNTRCPSCGGLLTFEPGRPGYCAIEAIFVEVTPEPVATDRPLLVRDAVLRASKKQLHDLCRAHGLRVSGNKTDLLTRLLRYMDENRIDLPPEERGEHAAPADLVEDLAPIPLLESPPVGASPPIEVLEEPPREPERTPLTAEVERLLQEIDHAAAVIEPATEAKPASEGGKVSAAKPSRVDHARLRRDRRTFYAGTILTTVGGVGLLLGSVFHDLLRVPFVGTAYGTFGPLNAAAAGAGGLVLLAGLVAIARSLRGGVVRTDAFGV